MEIDKAAVKAKNNKKLSYNPERSKDDVVCKQASKHLAHWRRSGTGIINVKRLVTGVARVNTRMVKHLR